MYKGPILWGHGVPVLYKGPTLCGYNERTEDHSYGMQHVATHTYVESQVRALCCAIYMYSGPIQWEHDAVQRTNPIWRRCM